MTFTEPKEWNYVQLGESEYNGRHFYGEHHDDMAELHYLRDWKRWADEQLQVLKMIQELFKP